MLFVDKSRGPTVALYFLKQNMRRDLWKLRFWKIGLIWTNLVSMVFRNRTWQRLGLSPESLPCWIAKDHGNEVGFGQQTFENLSTLGTLFTNKQANKMN